MSERIPPEHFQRSIRALNLHLIDIDCCVDDSWPIVSRSDAIPEGMTHFLPSQVDKHENDYVHFFIDDYRFERIWTSPERYVNLFKRYAGMVMPDFSTYTNMPIPIQMWNAYRNKALAAYYYDQGIEVIPSLLWSNERSFDWIFDGMPIGGTYALGTTGYDSSPELKEGFYTGLMEAMDCLKPDTLLVYGKRLDIELPCKMIYYANNSIQRLRDVDAKKRAEDGQEPEEPENDPTTTQYNEVVSALMGKILSYQGDSDKSRVLDENSETEGLFGLGGIYETDRT